MSGATRRNAAPALSISTASLQELTTFAWQADGAKITTIEGVAHGAQLHPMRKTPASIMAKHNAGSAHPA